MDPDTRAFVAVPLVVDSLAGAEWRARLGIHRLGIRPSSSSSTQRNKGAARQPTVCVVRRGVIQTAGSALCWPCVHGRKDRCDGAKLHLPESGSRTQHCAAHVEFVLGQRAAPCAERR